MFNKIYLFCILLIICSKNGYSATKKISTQKNDTNTLKLKLADPKSLIMDIGMKLMFDSTDCSEDLKILLEDAKKMEMWALRSK